VLLVLEEQDKLLLATEQQEPEAQLAALADTQERVGAVGGQQEIRQMQTEEVLEPHTTAMAEELEQQAQRVQRVLFLLVQVLEAAVEEESLLATWCLEVEREDCRMEQTYQAERLEQQGLTEEMEIR